jgi:hypothetical protein
MRDQLEVAGRRDTWRHTADLLFLLERPVLREAFFPSGAALPVERARPADCNPILDMARIHHGEDGAAIMAEWWKQAAHLFSVVRGTRVEKWSGFTSSQRLRTSRSSRWLRSAAGGLA